MTIYVTAISSADSFGVVNTPVVLVWGIPYVPEWGSITVYDPTRDVRFIMVDGVPSAEYFFSVDDIFVLSWAAAYDDEEYPVMYISVAEENTLQNTCMLEGTSFGVQVYEVPVATSVNGWLDKQGLGTWNRFREVALRLRVRGTSFANLQENIGILTKAVTQEKWELCIKRHPNSAVWDKYSMMRCSPFKVPFDRLQLTHYFADLDIPLLVRPEPAPVDDSDSVILVRSRIRPPHPESKRWPDNWMRDPDRSEEQDGTGQPRANCKGANVWWFLMRAQDLHGADMHFWYGANSAESDGVPLQVVGGQHYKASFTAMSYSFSGYYTCRVWFYQSDWSLCSPQYHTVFEKNGAWDTYPDKSHISSTFVTPANCSYIRIKFNMHDTSTDGNVRVRAVSLGLHY